MTDFLLFALLSLFHYDCGSEPADACAHESAESKANNSRREEPKQSADQHAPEHTVAKNSVIHIVSPDT
jgi:hypothetical protein